MEQENRHTRFRMTLLERMPSVTYFEQEIRAQPDILDIVLADEASKQTAGVLREKNLSLILTLARGSSDNAVTFFTYLAGRYLGLPVASVPPSLLTVYASSMKAANALAVGVSQSGESPDVIEGLRALGNQGAATVAVTNAEDSTLAGAAQHCIYQQAGPEKAVAASKTFTSQMMVLALLIAHWCQDEELLTALEQVPTLLRKLLSEQDAIERTALRFTYAENMYVLGRGLTYGPASELALKLKETSYLHAQAYSSAEFQHGPIAAVDPSDPILLLGTSDGTLESNVIVGQRLQELGASLTIISSAPGLLELAQAPLAMPEGFHPIAEAFGHVLAGQLLALHLTTAKGLDPDTPRHLKKVTRTF